MPFEPLGQYQVVIFYRGSSGPEGDLPGAWLLVQAFYPWRQRVSRRDWDEAQLTDITDQGQVWWLRGGTRPWAHAGSPGCCKISTIERMSSAEPKVTRA